MNPKVDIFLSKLTKWKPEMERLRMILLNSPLTEEVKWTVPIYTYEGKNIIGINGMKEYCSIAFFKGALLKDEANLLIQATEHTQAARSIHFTSVEAIVEKEALLKTYILEAIEAEKAGLKVQVEKPSDLPVPEEFQIKLDEIPGLNEAFKALTQGRQRGYLLYFSQAKQSATRASRVEQFIPRILMGKGQFDPE
jgi:uncharacterized protein YdeI (YjbR/CyaY-like superfamily)